MMNREKRTVSVMSAIALGGLLASTMALTGCSSEDEQPVAQERSVAPPPPAPERPTVRPVDELKAELRIDDRIFMAEDVAPATTDERKAILSFFDAFVRGDHRAVGRMLTDLDQRELERMVDSGRWDEATRDIRSVLIYQTGESPNNGPAVIALYETRDRDQVQLWYYTGSGDSFMFEAAPTPPDMVNRLSGTDWIGAWHKILEEEMELAMRPDQEFEAPQQVLDEDPDERRSGGSAPGGPQGPGFTPPSPSPPSGPRPPRRTPPSDTPPQ